MRDPYTNLNDAIFVTAINRELNKKDVPVEILYLINEYLMTNKIDFTPTTSHNPYSVADGMGFIELHERPVDVTSPAYVAFVSGLRSTINGLASNIKILNGYLNSCEFNEWLDFGGITPYRHNFHKLIAAIRHDLVYDYNALISIRVYWKNMYRIVRAHTIANQPTPTA